MLTGHQLELTCSNFFINEIYCRVIDRFACALFSTPLSLWEQLSRSRTWRRCWFGPDRVDETILSGVYRP